MMKRPHSPLTVGIDARTSLHVNTAGRGWGVYACELMRALQSFTETRFYCLVPDNELTRDLEREFRPFSHIVFRRVPYEIQTPNTYWSGAVTDFPEYWLGEVDVYHCLNRFLPPTNYEKGLVTIHDIAPLAARPSRSHLESATRAALSQIREKRFSVYTVSHATRRELSPYLDGDRVTTIHSGIKKVFGGPISIRRSDSKMILAVGGAGPNKNLANLVAAVARLRQRVPCRLYLAGAREWGYGELFRGQAPPPWVTLLGYVPDSRLAQLYGEADAFVSPSIHEGFGFPALEAMASGAEVCVSDIPVYRELLKGFAHYFDPDCPISIANCLLERLTAPSAEPDRRAAQQHAQAFSWEATARSLHTLYSNVAAPRRSISRRPSVRDLDGEAIDYARGRYARERQRPIAQALREIDLVGGTAWDLLKYSYLEAFYEAYFAAKSRGSAQSFWPTCRHMLERGQWDASIVGGLLENRLWPLGVRLRNRKWARRLGATRPPVLQNPGFTFIGGYAIRVGPVGLSPLFEKDEPRLFQPWTDFLDPQESVGETLGLPYFRTESLLTHADLIRAREIERKVAHLPLSLLGPHGKSTRLLSRIFLYLTATERLFDRYAPAKVILPDERLPLARGLALLARRKQIAALSFPDVVDQYVRKMPFEEILSSKAFALNAELAGHLVRHRANPPRFSVATLGRAVAIAGKGASPRPGRRILFCCQGLVGEGERIKKLSRLVQNWEGAELVVRPHPVQNERFLKFWHAGTRVSRKASPGEAIEEADLVIAHSSTMAVEAAARQRPVILWTEGGSPELLPLLRRDAAIWVSQFCDLEKAIRNLWRSSAGLAAAYPDSVSRQIWCSPSV